MSEPERKQKQRLRETLTKREKLFANYVVRGKTVMEAYRLAGYSVRNSHIDTIDANTIRNRPRVKAYIEWLQRLIEGKTVVTATRVIEEIARVAFVDFSKIYGPDGKLLPVDEWPIDCKAAISSIDVVETKGEDGVKCVVKKVRLCDKLKALDMLARRFNLYQEHNQSKAVNVQIHASQDLQKLSDSELLQLASSGAVVSEVVQPALAEGIDGTEGIEGTEATEDNG